MIKTKTKTEYRGIVRDHGIAVYTGQWTTSLDTARRNASRQATKRRRIGGGRSTASVSIQERRV